MQLLRLLIFKSLIYFSWLPESQPELGALLLTQGLYKKCALLSLSTFTNSAVSICPVNYFVQ